MVMLVNEWRKYYHGYIPAGFVLRQKFHDRWLRVHYLPHSKRYPENATDKKELLKRSIATAQHVLGDKGIYLLSGLYSETQNKVIKKQKGGDDLIFEHFKSYDISENEDSSYFLNCFFTHFSWNETLFKKIILGVANEEMGPILFFSLRTKGVFAPYDGGIDLFYFRKNQRKDGVNLFKTWMSNRPDGL